MLHGVCSLACYCKASIGANIEMGVIPKCIEVDYNQAAFTYSLP
jgi:hypothetical protein